MGNPRFGEMTMKKATAIRAKPKPHIRMVKLLVEEQMINEKYSYFEVYISEKLAEKLYNEGTIWWNLTNEIFGCDIKKFRESWIVKNG